MKLIFVFVLIAIVGCNDDFVPYDMKNNNILVSGQSNAYLCDWSYFEEISGYKVTNISVPGKDIDELIGLFEPSIMKSNHEIMVFVHGESDSVRETYPREYIQRVHDYQNLTGVNYIYFSTVGYTDHAQKDWSFDLIRNAVIDASDSIDYWKVGYNDARTFRDRGMLIDHVHFSQSGCKEMMASIHNSLVKDGF